MQAVILFFGVPFARVITMLVIESAMRMAIDKNDESAPMQWVNVQDSIRYFLGEFQALKKKQQQHN